MLDLDAKTFAELTGGTFNSDTLADGRATAARATSTSSTSSPSGATGVGKKNYPVAFSTGAWSHKDNNPATPPKIDVVND